MSVDVRRFTLRQPNTATRYRAHGTFDRLPPRRLPIRQAVHGAETVAVRDFDVKPSYKERLRRHFTVRKIKRTSVKSYSSQCFFSVVSIESCPNESWTCSIGETLLCASLANVHLRLCGAMPVCSSFRHKRRCCILPTRSSAPPLGVRPCCLDGKGSHHRPEQHRPRCRCSFSPTTASAKCAICFAY